MRISLQFLGTLKCLRNVSLFKNSFFFFTCHLCWCVHTEIWLRLELFWYYYTRVEMQYNNTKQKPIRNTSYQGSTKYSILNTKTPNCTARANEISRANKHPNTSYTDAISFSLSVSSNRNRNNPWLFFHIKCKHSGIFVVRVWNFAVFI